MNTTLEVRSATKDALNGMIKKDELLSLMKMLDQEGNQLELPTSAKNIPQAELKARDLRTRQSRATLAMLRRYFVMRIAQSRGYAAEEVF